jgi:hypothetical protein
MTERSPTGTEREFVCPFVAYDEDRDYRASVPDHRHRCFAESPAASRALAHQAAYCLSSAFAGCPTFIDWARREAAPPKDEPIRTLREAPTARREVDRSSLPASRPTAPQSAPAPSGRQRRAEWTAPPPWAPDAGLPARDADLEDEAEGPAGRPDPRFRGDDTPDVAPDVAPDGEEDSRFGAPESPGLGAWSGSALGALAASGSASMGRPAGSPASGAEVDRGAGPIPGGPVTPAFLAGRAARPGPRASAQTCPRTRTGSTRGPRSNANGPGLRAPARASDRDGRCRVRVASAARTARSSQAPIESRPIPRRLPGNVRGGSRPIRRSRPAVGASPRCRARCCMG